MVAAAKEGRAWKEWIARKPRRGNEMKRGGHAPTQLMVRELQFRKTTARSSGYQARGDGARWQRLDAEGPPVKLGCLSTSREPRPAGSSPEGQSVSLTGKRRFSDADVERARLLHQYALHRSSADAQRLADLQYARAALVEAQDLFSNWALLMPQRSSSALRSPSFLLPRPSLTPLALALASPELTRSTILARSRRRRRTSETWPCLREWSYRSPADAGTDCSEAPEARSEAHTKPSRPIRRAAWNRLEANLALFERPTNDHNVSVTQLAPSIFDQGRSTGLRSRPKLARSRETKRPKPQNRATELKPSPSVLVGCHTA
jgi:hypothetical protein